MGVLKIILLILGMLISGTAFSQFYIGFDIDYPSYDSSVVIEPEHYPPALNIPVRKLELYQDSSSNRLVLVNNLKNKKIVYPFSYQVKQDTVTGGDYLWVKRDKTIAVKLRSKQPLNELKAYKRFVKINEMGNTDPVFIAKSEEITDGIDRLDVLWRIADKDIPCDLFIDFKSNCPRHSNISYYYLDFDFPCLNVASTSACKERI